MRSAGMRGALDNPVTRHASRLGSRGARPYVILALLIAAGALGAFLQKNWLVLSEYNLLRPAFAVGLLGFTLLAETMIVLPWAAVRGALLWRRLRLDGHLDDYRRSRLSPLAIVSGAAWGAGLPLLLMLAASLFLALSVAFRIGVPTPAQALLAHGVIATEAAAFLALGLYLGDRMRYVSMAVPISLSLLAATLGPIWLLEPFYKIVTPLESWIWWALLPNPLTAVGTALDTDVLRFGWLYSRLHAHEYFFQYPLVWQSALFYLILTVWASGALVRRVRRAERS
jgi:hypothetical protein